MSSNETPNPVSAELGRLLSHDGIRDVLLDALGSALRAPNGQLINKTHGLHLTFSFHPKPPSDCLSAKYLLANAEVKPIGELGELPTLKGLPLAERKKLKLHLEDWQKKAADSLETTETLMLVATAAPPRVKQASGATASRVALRDDEMTPIAKDWLSRMKESYIEVRDLLGKYREVALLRSRTHRKDACGGCGKMSPPHKLMLCSRCKNAKYCSATCQRGQYASHRQFCFLHKSQNDSTISKGHPADERIVSFIDTLIDDTHSAFASATSLYTPHPLQDHILVVELAELRANPSTLSPAQLLEVRSAVALPEDDVLHHLASRMSNITSVIASVPLHIRARTTFDAGGSAGLALFFLAQTDRFQAQLLAFGPDKNIAPWALRALLDVLDRDEDWVELYKSRPKLADSARTIEVKAAGMLTPKEHARWRDGCIL